MAGITQVRECAQVAGRYALADGVVAQITAEITPTQFDALCAANPGYRLNMGVSVFDQFFPGTTALEVAISVNNIPLFDHIISLGARDGLDLLNLAGSMGFHSLVNAVGSGHNSYYFARELLRAGADVNLASSGLGREIAGGQTALHLAATRKDERLIRLFVSYGAVIPQRAEDYVHAPCRRCGCLVGRAAQLLMHQQRFQREAFENYRWKPEMLATVEWVVRNPVPSLQQLAIERVIATQEHPHLAPGLTPTASAMIQEVQGRR